MISSSLIPRRDVHTTPQGYGSDSKRRPGGRRSARSASMTCVIPSVPRWPLLGRLCARFRSGWDTATTGRPASMRTSRPISPTAGDGQQPRSVPTPQRTENGQTLGRHSSRPARVSSRPTLAYETRGHRFASCRARPIAERFARARPLASWPNASSSLSTLGRNRREADRDNRHKGRFAGRSCEDRRSAREAVRWRV